MKKQVLLIDDQESIFELFRDILEGLDCQLAWAASGEAGLGHLRNEPCDIVFLDLNLGGSMDGVETLKRMHAAGITPRVYVITGFYEDYMDALNRLGKQEKVAFEIVRKPVDVGLIREIVSGI